MGGAVFPPCCLTWGRTVVEIMKIMVTSFKTSHILTAALSAIDPEADYRRPTPPPETPGHSWAHVGQFLVGSLLLSPGSWCAWPKESVSPVLTKFWWFCGGINGDLLQEDLCHTQVCYTLSPCGRPLLTCTSTGDTQTQSWLSLCGLGVHFAPFPGLSSSGDQVFGESTVSGMLYVSSEELISGCNPPGICQPSRISGRLVSSWEPAHSLVEDAIPGLRL